MCNKPKHSGHSGHSTCISLCPTHFPVLYVETPTPTCEVFSLQTMRCCFLRCSHKDCVRVSKHACAPRCIWWLTVAMRKAAVRSDHENGSPFLIELSFIDWLIGPRFEKEPISDRFCATFYEPSRCPLAMSCRLAAGDLPRQGPNASERSASARR